MSVFTLNPLAMPFVPTQKAEGRVGTPGCDKPQSTPSCFEPTIVNGSAGCPVDRSTPVESISPNSHLAEPFPYYTDPISGQSFMTNHQPPQKRHESEKQEGDSDRAFRPVDISLVVRLPLALKLVIVYKITPAKPYRVFSHSIFIHTDCCTNDTESMVQDVIHEDLRQCIRDNDIPFKDRNAYASGRIDFKTKVLRQGVDARDQHSFLGPHTPLWFALSPQVRERVARGQKFDEHDVSLRVTVTVFEGFPLRHLWGGGY